MNETILLWILGIFVTVIILIGGAIVQHIKECREVRSKLAEIGNDVKHLIADMGTHDTGLRGTVHKSANRLIEHEGRIVTLEGGWKGQR